RASSSPSWQPVSSPVPFLQQVWEPDAPVPALPLPRLPRRRSPTLLPRSRRSLRHPRRVRHPPEAIVRSRLQSYPSRNPFRPPLGNLDHLAAHPGTGSRKNDELPWPFVPYSESNVKHAVARRSDFFDEKRLAALAPKHWVLPAL